jgi:ubiquinone/menaquinone biosynthesis C-methylase UbiE
LGTHRSFHDDEERRRWQNPEEILSAISVKAGSVFMDIGCGSGFFTIPAARIIGNHGKVYALDMSRDAVALLKERAVVEGLRNIVAEVGVAEDMIFCEACADIVFFGIVLHDFNDPDKVLLNAGKMLKPVGRLVDLDWKKEPMQLGPPLDVRFSEEQAIGLIRGDGFQIDSVDDSGLYHYLVVATHRQVTSSKTLSSGPSSSPSVIEP